MHEISDEQRFLFDLQGYLILRGAIEKGWQRDVIEPWLLRACSMHWIGFGHGLIYVTKTFDLLELAGWKHAAHLLPATLLALGSI